jgi:hypothetical protein
MGGERHDPAALLSGKDPGTHFIGGWVDRSEWIRKITGVRTPNRPARNESL